MTLRPRGCDGGRNLALNTGDAGVAEGILAGDRVVGGGAEGEDVPGRVEGPAPNLFGGHERGRADPHTGLGDRSRGCLDRSGDAEVDHPGAVGGEDDVPRLEVAVDHPGGVDGLQRLRDPGEQDQDGLRRQGALAGDGRGERGGGDVGGGQPGARGVGVAVDDRRGVQALDPLGDRDFRGAGSRWSGEAEDVDEAAGARATGVERDRQCPRHVQIVAQRRVDRSRRVRRGAGAPGRDIQLVEGVLDSRQG